MEWKTSISQFTKDKSIIKGFNHLDLIGSISFTQMIYILLKGKKPLEKETAMLDALFVSSIDHGIEVPSIIAARTVASTGNPFQAAVSTGILSLGEYHGGAIEKCAKQLSNLPNAKEIVFIFLTANQKFPGFGHKLYKDFDPRTVKLSKIAKELGFFGKHCKLIFEIEKELELQKGNKLCINIDGIFAALLLDLGFSPKIAKAFFIMSRTPGICTHVYEELTEEKPFRRLNDSKYKGE